MAWVQKWAVTGTSGKEYTVAMREDGSFGCDCPAWKFQRGGRKDCQHILQKKLEFQQEAAQVKYNYYMRVKEQDRATAEAPIRKFNFED